jgi:hypothetical protein
MASVASAQTPILLTISGNEAKGAFELPGGIAGDLSVSFEDALGLNEDALEASVRLVDPMEPGLRSRLPGSEVTVPQAFPVLIRIEPTPSSGLTIAGIVSISLHTHNLVLAANSPLALYSGPADGSLRDMTRSVGIGSYRAGGSGGGFGNFGGGIGPSGVDTDVSDASEYIIVADARPIDQVIAEKLQVLESALNGDLTRTNEEVAALPVDGVRYRRALRRLDAFNELHRRFTQVRTLYASGAVTSAIAEVTGLMDYLKTKSGDAISDVWRAHDSRTNIAGQRRAAADTLRFSLVKSLPDSPAPTPTPTPLPAP